MEQSSWAVSTLCRRRLGAAATINEGMLTKASADGLSVQDALFKLELPVFYDPPTKDLIKIRQESWQYFEAFRLAELVANTRKGSTDRRSAIEAS